MSASPTPLPTVHFLAIPLAEIVPSETNPRKLRDNKALKDLASSIAEKGVLEPILVRPATSGTNGVRFEIIAGERRYLASQIAGKPDIPAIVREMDDRQVLEAQVIENLQREDVHELDEAEGYRRLIEMPACAGRNAGYTPEVVAEKVGKSKAYVYGRLQLLKLEPKAREIFYKGQMNVAVAHRLSRLQPKDQLRAVKYFGSDDDGGFRATLRDVDDWIHREVFLNLDGAAFKKDDAELYPEAGACTACPKRTGASPLLFPDLQNKRANTCTDPVCFNEKVNRFVELQVTQNPEAVRIIAGFVDYQKLESLKRQGVLGPGDYADSAKDACPHTAQAVVVAGDGGYDSETGNRKPAAIGETKFICPAKDCKVHRSYSYETPEARAERLARLKEEKIRKAVERAVFQALAEKLMARKKELTDDELRTVADQFLGLAGFYVHQEIAPSFGYDRKADKGKPWNKAGPSYFMTEYAKKLSRTELEGFLLALALRRDQVLAKACRKYGVDVKGIEKAIRAKGQGKGKKAQRLVKRALKKVDASCAKAEKALSKKIVAYEAKKRKAG